MKIYNVTIIGGGVSGMTCALTLAENGIQDVLILERNDRVGKKLSSTGNGQGNITNLSLSIDNYHSVEVEGFSVVKSIIDEFDNSKVVKYFNNMGCLTTVDDRNRVYPSSKQASSLTDLLRFKLANTSVELSLSSYVTKIEKEENFKITLENGKVFYSRKVALCNGGKSSKNFGSDGNGYDLAKSLNHSITKLYPSLVQLKCKDVYKNLKGVRVDTCLTAFVGDKKIASAEGEVIFTDYGLSGNGIFYLTPRIVDKQGVKISIELLPEFTRENLYNFLIQKVDNSKEIIAENLLCGVVNNQLSKVILKRLNIQQDKNISGLEVKKIVNLIKDFSFDVVGTLGFDYSQVTKGGVKLCEVNDNLMSRLTNGLYFAGEILDVDGDCGGYNLQWAFSSGRKVALSIVEEFNR